MLTIKQKIQHLINLGFSGDMSEIEKFYSGQNFNKKDLNIQKLIKYSTALWQEYSKILKDLPRAVNEEERTALMNRKEQIISIAFPDHGMFGNFCDGFYCTIGAVDFDKESISGFNKNVKFGKYTIAELGNYALIGEDVKIGATFGGAVQPNKKVIIADDTWICASTIIGAGSTLSSGTVLALGACLYPNQKTEVNSLAVGNPCETKLIIDENYQSKKNNFTHRSDEEIQYIINHIRYLGMDVDDAYMSALNGEKYNCFSSRIAQITEYSHNLSYEFNNPLTTKERRKEIIEILFPIRGNDFRIGRGLFVDILGLAKVGNNVRIGDNSFFAGNVVIKNNVNVGKDCIFAGIGHELPAAGRRLRMYNNIFGEVCEVGKIHVGDNVTIGNNCTLAPGSELTCDLSDNNFVVGRNKTFAKQASNDYDDVFVK